jgi:uncharacterized protein YxjI
MIKMEGNMRYQVRQKLFTIGDQFYIKDEQGNDVFTVKRQIMSVGKKLRIYDMAQNELCYIEQKLFKFMPEYLIFLQGELLATVKKKFALLKNDFTIIGNDVNYYVDGNAWGHEFSIKKDDVQVAAISKKYISLSDTYTVDIEDSENQVALIAMTIVIDMVLHDRRN